MIFFVQRYSIPTNIIFIFFLTINQINTNNTNNKKLPPYWTLCTKWLFHDSLHRAHIIYSFHFKCGCCFHWADIFAFYNCILGALLIYSWKNHINTPANIAQMIATNAKIAVCGLFVRKNQMQNSQLSICWKWIELNKKKPVAIKLFCVNGFPVHTDIETLHQY